MTGIIQVKRNRRGPIYGNLLANGTAQNKVLSWQRTDQIFREDSVAGLRSNSPRRSGGAVGVVTTCTVHDQHRHSTVNVNPKIVLINFGGDRWFYYIALVNLDVKLGQ